MSDRAPCRHGYPQPRGEAAAIGAIAELELAAVALDDITYDCKPEPAPVGAACQSSEAAQGDLPRLGRDAGSLIDHCRDDATVFFVHRRRHAAALDAVTDRVVDQIADRLAEHDGIAAIATAGGLWTGREAYLALIAAVVLGVYVFGFMAGMAIFFLAFLLTVAKASPARAVVLTASALGFMFALSWAMTLHLPEGLLPEMISDVIAG